MRKQNSKREAVQALRNWLHSVTHAQLAPVEEPEPSPAADRIERVFETLRQAIQDERLYLTSCDEGLRSPVGPMLVLLDGDGALIAGVGGPRAAKPRELPPELRRRFTWP
jgi:hypothetical protein